MRKIPDITISPKVGEDINAPSPLANPYSHKDDTPADYRVDTVEEAIVCYEMRLRSHLRTATSRTVNELDRLATIALTEGRLVLRCWCAPGPCHGDVIKKIILEAIEASST